MKAVMFFAEGFEEVEALSTVDVLRRGGVEVEMTSISDKLTVRGARDIEVVMNTTMDEIDILNYDAVLLPGGMPGTIYLKESEKVKTALIKANESHKLIGAICAAPIVLGNCGLLKGRKATCYPGQEEGLVGAEIMTDDVVVDDNVVTSRGVGTALTFAVEVLRLLTNEKNSKKVADSILYS